MPRSSAREGLLPVGRLAERQRAGSAASSILTDAADGGPVEPAPADTPAVLLQKMRELAWAGGPVQVVADATGEAPAAASARPARCRAASPTTAAAQAATFARSTPWPTP